MHARPENIARYEGTDAGEMPAKVAAMSQQWQSWARAADVKPTPQERRRARQRVQEHANRVAGEDGAAGEQENRRLDLNAGDELGGPDAPRIAPVPLAFGKLSEPPSTNLFTVYPERYEPRRWETNWSEFE